MATLIERWTPAGPIKSPADVSEDQIAHEEVRAAATVAEAAPLGLAAFATGTFTVSSVLAGWWPASALIWAVPPLLVFAGVGQFIAAMWSYRKGDMLGATAFGSFGAFNVSFAFMMLVLRPPAVMTGDPAHVTGIWIACFSYIALFLAIAALRRSMALFLVLLALAGAYGCIAAALIGSGWPVITIIGGWCGIVSSVVAFYTAGATVINGENLKEVIPLGAMHPSASHNGQSPRGETVRETTYREQVR